MNKLRVVGWLLISSAILLAGISALSWFDSDEYTVLVDDEAHTIEGSFNIVSELLVAAGIEVGPYDSISPSPSTPLEDGDVVKIARARSVEVHTESGSEVFWTLEGMLTPFLEESGIEIGPSYEIRVGDILIDYEEIDTALLDESIFVSPFKTIQISDGGFTKTVTTDAETVSQVIREAGIELLSADSVEPEQGAWLRPDMKIQITRSDPIVISVDGLFINLRTNAVETADVLAEAGIVLGELDYSLPGPEFEIVPGNIIKVIRVTEEIFVEDETIPYESLFQGTDTLEIDRRALLVQGETGIARRQIRIRYEDGLEVSRTVDGEWVEEEAIDEITGYGTRIEIRVLDTPDGTYEYWRAVRMRVTAYTASSSGKPPEHPAYGITASGAIAGTGVVAIDPKVVPFRSWVYVPGYGIGYAGDTGGGVKGRWIDLGYDEDELVAWSSYVDVYYLTPVPPPDDINYVIPTVLP